MDDRMEKVMRALERNQIKTFFAHTKESVPPLVEGLLREGNTVTVGGSESLFEAGVIDLLRCGPYCFLDRYEPGLTREQVAGVYFEAMGSDAYLCSANAVTETGELYNVDGNANRISAIAHGPKSVIMVVGKNKLVSNLDAAIRRVKTIVAPEICKRRGRDTYCAQTGHCVSLTEDVNGMTSGCDSPQRTCCTYLVTGRQRVRDRVKVILVGEALGI